MEYNYRNLVFEGGGVKGVAYGGALKELESIGVLSNIKRVAGTSAGAITAALLAVGYSTDEISKIISETDFSKFEDNTFFIIGDISRIFKRFGWNKGDAFRKWMEKLIKAKTGSENFSFGALRERIKRGEGNLKDLYVVCSNITKQRAEILSHETTPNLSIAYAVRMSMSIPFFFAAIKNAEGDVIVDGGVTLNYPIQIFDKAKYLDNPSNGIKVNYNIQDDYVFNYETLGMRVDSKKEIDYLNPGWAGDPSLTKNIKSFVGAILNFMMEMANSKHLHSNDWNRTIFIDSADVKTTEFKLKENKIKMLLENGKNAVISYFKWKDNHLTWSLNPHF